MISRKPNLDQVKILILILWIVKKYRRKIIPITDILVNSKNPRFEPVKNQKEAIELMLAAKKVKIMNIAKHISEHGLNPSKNPIVIKHGKKYITQEGNHRIISLKLLNDPKNTNDPKLREFFSNLKDKKPDIPTKISCIVCENEKDAKFWIELYSLT